MAKRNPWAEFLAAIIVTATTTAIATAASEASKAASEKAAAAINEAVYGKPMVQEAVKGTDYEVEDDGD